MRNLFFCGIVFLILSCSENDNVNGNRIIDESITLNEESNFEHLDGNIIRMYADDSSVYISNAPDTRIFVYNYSGKLIKKLGKAGPAPWENGTIWHFSIDNKQKSYWVQDYSKQLLKKYSLEKDTLIAYSKILTLNNVQYIGESKFIVTKLHDKTGDFLVTIYNAANNLFEKEISLQKRLDKDSTKKLLYQDFVFEGDFARAPNSEKILFYCYRAGAFFLIDTTTFKITIFNDIRGFPIPKVTKKNSEIHFEPNNVVSLSGTLDSNYIYLLTLKRSSNTIKNNDFLMDIYNIETGRYIKSIIIPKYNNEETPIKIVKISDGLIVGYLNGRIVKYKFDNSQIIENEKNQPK